MTDNIDDILKEDILFDDKIKNPLLTLLYLENTDRKAGPAYASFSSNYHKYHSLLCLIQDFKPWFYIDDIDTVRIRKNKLYLVGIILYKNLHLRYNASNWKKQWSILQCNYLFHDHVKTILETNNANKDDLLQNTYPPDIQYLINLGIEIGKIIEFKFKSLVRGVLKQLHTGNDDKTIRLKKNFIRKIIECLRFEFLHSDVKIPSILCAIINRKKSREIYQLAVKAINYKKENYKICKAGIVCGLFNLPVKKPDSFRTFKEQKEIADILLTDVEDDIGEVRNKRGTGEQTNSRRTLTRIVQRGAPRIIENSARSDSSTATTVLENKNTKPRILHINSSPNIKLPLCQSNVEKYSPELDKIEVSLTSQIVSSVEASMNSNLSKPTESSYELFQELLSVFKAMIGNNNFMNANVSVVDAKNNI